MDVELPVTIHPQPNDTTCGPTCLHAVLQYFGEQVTLAEIVRSIRMLGQGGTLAVFLACEALRRGYHATIYTYNVQMFDPVWFQDPKTDIREKLVAQSRVKHGKRLRQATEGFLEFLELGGKIRLADLTTGLIRGILRRRVPILTGLSSTYLYREPREYGDDDHPDDIRGEPAGHFVLLNGYHRQGRTVMIADPLIPNPASTTHLYSVNIDRVICSILLGVLTHDANLLVIYPKSGKPQ